VIVDDDGDGDGDEAVVVMVDDMVDDIIGKVL
jgi:hypothetical protein